MSESVTRPRVVVTFAGSGDAFGSGGLPFLILDGQFSRRSRQHVDRG